MLHHVPNFVGVRFVVRQHAPDAKNARCMQRSTSVKYWSLLQGPVRRSIENAALKSEQHHEGCIVSALKFPLATCRKQRSIALLANYCCQC